MKVILLLIIAVALVAWLGTTAASQSPNSPFSPICPGIASTPGDDYLFESRAIYAYIKDQSHYGFCWYVENPGDLDRFCNLILWTDPSATCQAGPAPVGAMSVIWRYYLPTIQRQ